MLSNINSSFNAAKRTQLEDRFITESVLDVEEIIPGSEEELDDIVDSDSVPEDVYKRVDKALDELIGKEDYDDTEVEELIDDDDDEDFDDEEIDAIVNEAVDAWFDNECIGHPDNSRRCPETDKQPVFGTHGSLV